MSNQIDTLIPKIIARGLLSLRQKAILPRLVNADFSALAARPGDRVDVPVAAPVTVADVTPSHTPPQPPDSTLSSVSVTLDKWKRASFYLTDRDMTRIDASADFLPLQMTEAVAALAAAVNRSVLDLHVRAAAHIGSPGQTPFDLPPANRNQHQTWHGTDSAIQGRRLLNAAHAPKSGRFAILNFDAEARALGLPQFAEADKAGAASVPLEGEIGRRFGLDWYAVDEVGSTNTGAPAATLTANAGKGASRLSLRLTSGQLRTGDSFYVDGAPQTVYRLTSDHPGRGQTAELSVTPQLAADIAKSATLVFPASAPVNLMMHRDAVALVMRPLTTGGMETGGGSQMMTVTDPDTGLSLRLEVSRQYKQTVWEFDLLWGVALVRPDWMVALHG